MGDPNCVASLSSSRARVLAFELMVGLCESAETFVVWNILLDKKAKPYYILG